MSQPYAAQQGAEEARIDAEVEVAHDLPHDQAETHERPRTKETATQATASSTTSTPPNANNDEDQSSILREPSDDVQWRANHAEAAAACVTTTPPDSSNPEHAVNGTTTESVTPVIPSEASKVIVPPAASPFARDTTPPPTPAPNTTNITTTTEHPLSVSEAHSNNTLPGEQALLHAERDGAARPSTHEEGKMGFGHGPSKQGVSQRRRNFANTNALTEQEADLTNTDRATQREAVAKFLATNVKSDWEWEWPRPTTVTAEPTSPTDLQSPTSELSQVQTEQWKERDEWSDNASEGAEDPSPSKIAARTSIVKEDPFRFDSPDGVGDTIKKIETDRKRRRRKRIADEMAWNDGMRCFYERRDAWTGARRVSRSPKAGMTPIQKHLTSTSQSSEDGGSSTALEQEEESEWEADIEIPIAPPFLPPENSMRASIGPAAYPTIYDKIILNQMTPLCPINLKDITRSCVKGWQRDGEWPPKPEDMPKAMKRRTLSVAGLFGFEKPELSKEKTNEEKKEGDKASSYSHSPGSGIGSKLGKMLHLKKKA